MEPVQIFALFTLVRLWLYIAILLTSRLYLPTR